MAIRVIGVGDNVVDKYMHTKTMYPGGNAFNFSAYASMLGASSSYMGVFGSDEAAQLVQATARELGIDTSHCRVEEGENGYAMITLVMATANSWAATRAASPKKSRSTLRRRTWNIWTASR